MRVQRPQNFAVHPKQKGPHRSDESLRKTKGWGTGQGVLFKWGSPHCEEQKSIHLGVWERHKTVSCSPFPQGEGVRVMGDTGSASPHNPVRFVSQLFRVPDLWAGSHSHNSVLTPLCQPQLTLPDPREQSLRAICFLRTGHLRQPMPDETSLC